MLANTTNSPVNRYGPLCAEIYDLDKPVGALPDTAFHLQRLRGFPGAILEPACGTGRTLLPLAEAGCDVTGFDRSEEMLDRCRARFERNGLAANLSRQELEDFAYDRRFDAILMPVGSFTLIDDYDRAVALLRRFHAHLAPGGVVVLDLAPLSLLSHRGDDIRQWSAPNGDLLTLEGRRVKTDWLAQRAEFRVRYERWRDNRLVESEMEPMAQRYWGLEEFRLALVAAGFADVAVVGGYDRGRAPLAGDRVLTVEARPP